MLDDLIYIATALIAIGIPLIYFLRSKKKSAHAASVLAKSVERGQDEPVSLHPFIELNSCMGTGACIQACPEVDVLGLIANRAALINPSHCVGHGLCEAACPTDAITLVFGTEKRGVDIPFVSGSFETNVPGMYIAGELGGMGLIRNAFRQGREAVEYISKSLPQGLSKDLLDLVIVGAGPAGIAASLQAKKENLKFVTLDQEDMGGAILTYPRRKLVMTQPAELPIYGTLKAREIQKESLMEIFTEVFARTGLKITAGEKVEDIQRNGDGFRVTTPKGTYAARRVLLAIGRRGTPRKLNVPGEKSSKVAYRLLEPEQFRETKLLVVGGGDSAVEAALALAQQAGNTVHVSYRREGFFRLKERNTVRIEAAVQSGIITPLFNSDVKEITPDSVLLEQGGKTLTLPNDFVFVFAGGELPTEFLKKVGIEVQRKFGEMSEEKSTIQNPQSKRRAILKWLFGFLVSWILVSSVQAQISPGKLSRFHSSLEGISNCTQCHALGEEVSSGKCLACHTAVQSRISAGTGYHSAAEVKDAKCASCHSEHNGLDFELVNWPGGKQSFDHSLTGFTLEGAHRGKECSACHRGSFLADNAVKGSKNVNATRTFLGLGEACTNCHADEHEGQLPETCQNCHNADAWKPARGFSHSQTKYALTGKHAEAKCEKCHSWQTATAAVSDKIQKKDHIGQYEKYAGLTFPNCTPCHADKHNGQFGGDCEKCHVTASFHSIAGTAFDHAKTKYPLSGMHRSVQCQKCHTSGDMTKPLAYAACKVCHKDEHNGQFAARKDQGACDGCHTLNGYIPSTFGIDDHAKSRYALAGSHLAVPCSDCHIKSSASAPAQFKCDDLTCKSCHKDAHEGQLDLWVAKGGCEFCHNTESWHRTSFDHKLARFALEGKHREVLCLKCHKVVKQDGKDAMWMKPLTLDCAGCHKDPHEGQFVRADRGEKQADCKRCHSAEGWKQLTFVHNRDTQFRLDGAHEKAACAACHPGSKDSTGAIYTVYRPLKSECSACHASKRES